MKQPYEMGPTSELTFTFDLTAWATREAVTISSYTVDASATLQVGTHSRAAAVIKVPLKWASNTPEGTAGWCRCTVITSGTPRQVDSRTLLLRCRQL